MSPEDSSLLEDHRTELMTKINLKGSLLLDELLQRKALQRQQVDVIEVKQSQILLEKAGIKFIPIFITTVDEKLHWVAANGHVVSEVAQNRKPHSKWHMVCSFQLAVMWSENDWSFCVRLMNAGILQQSQNTEAGKIGQMLDFLLKGRADTMDKFIHSLRATKQDHVAEKYLRRALTPDTQIPDGGRGNNESQTIIAISGTQMVTVTLLEIQPYSQCTDRPVRYLANLMW